MPMTRLQTVRVLGWTPELLRRATAALVEVTTDRPEGPDREDCQLAVELARWLHYVSTHDTDALARHLVAHGPPRQSAPQWEELDAILSADQPMPALIAQLTARYTDPVRTLCDMLDELAPPELPWEEVEEEHQRAVAALWTLGTVESLSYLLSRLMWMDWEEIDGLDDVLRVHRDAVKALALRTWPSLSRKDRYALVLFLDDRKLHDDRFFALLMEAVEKIDGPEDHMSCAQLLATYRDRRAIPSLHMLVDRALDAFELSRTDVAAAVVRASMRQLYEIDSEPRASARARAALCGLDQR
jgi:hypothetical protein